MHLHFHGMKSLLLLQNAFRIIPEHVLRPEFAKNVCESFVQFVEAFRIKNPAAGGRRESCQRMLTTRVSSRISSDGDHHDWVNYRIGALCGRECILVSFVTGRVPAVGNDHHDVTAISIRERIARKIHGIV